VSIAEHSTGRAALDLGCGAGRSTRFLKQLGFNAIGIDISSRMIQLAKNADPNGEYRLAENGEFSAFESASFDLVLSAFTFAVPIAMDFSKVRRISCRPKVKDSPLVPESKIRSQARQDALYAYPKEKSIRRFMDQVRQRTKRGRPLRTKELIAELNPLLRGWGEYYKRAQVRKLFQRLDGWIRRRIWSHRYRRWRNAGWKQLPATKLYGEYELVQLLSLISSLASWRR
jgi:SAM-dependent methyltransferase